MTELAVCKLTQCSQRELAHLYALSNQERRRKADALRLPEKRVQSLTAGLLLSYLQARVKKPYFSLSHSEEYCVAAVSDCPVGVDVEAIRPVLQSVWRRVCTAQELAILAQSNAADEDFIRFWTLKEAYFKASGGQSSLAVMRSACFAAEPPKGYRFSSGRLGNSIISLCERLPTAQ